MLAPSFSRRSADAWKPGSPERVVQLRGAGSPCAGRPSVADHQGGGGRCPEDAVADVHRHVQPDGPPVDSPGAVAEGPTPDRPVLGPWPPAVLRVTGLQHSVSVVSGHVA